jgi:hypothetical protein
MSNSPLIGAGRAGPEVSRPTARIPRCAKVSSSRIQHAMSLSIDSRLRLGSGATIPQYGFGSTPETYESVTAALEFGIRHCG